MFIGQPLRIIKENDKVDHLIKNFNRALLICDDVFTAISIWVMHERRQ